MKIKNRRWHKKRYTQKRFIPWSCEIWIKPYSEVNKPFVKIQSLFKKRPELVDILDEIRENMINRITFK